jgi:RNA polymerase primary sigma factor
MDMLPAPLSPESPPENYRARVEFPAEDLALLKENLVHQELFEDPEPIEETERRTATNQSAMDLYLKDPALRRPILDNEKQRALFARLAEARTAYSREITRHPLALVYLNRLYERIGADEIGAEDFSFQIKKENEEPEQMCELRFLAFLECASDFRLLYQENLSSVRMLQESAGPQQLSKARARLTRTLEKASEFVGDLALVRGHFEALSELVKHHFKSLVANTNAFPQDALATLDPQLGLDMQELEERAMRIARAELDIEKYRTHAIENGLRFVIHVAARYQGHGLDLLDLIQEGNVGLMRAVDRFDYRRGASFPTFGIFWIRKCIEEALRDKARIIRLPSDRHYLVGKIKKMTAHLTQVLRREPSAAELAKELHVSPKLVENLLALAKPPVSLHSPLLSEDEGRENELADILADPEARLPSDLVDRRYLAKVLPEMLRALPSELRETLELRFGLNGKEELTLKEIGTIIGHAKQAIHVRQLQALKKLRHAAKIKLLQGLEEL